MNSTFDTELTEMLHQLADEIGPLPTDLATDALRSGRRIRARRTAAAALASIAVLAALAAPAAFIATRHGGQQAAGRSTVQVTVTARDDRTATIAALKKRFHDTGITVVRTTSKDGATRFTLRANESQATLRAQVTQLLTMGELQIRPVLASVPMPKVTGSITRSSGPTPTLEEVKTKLGTAYATADGLTAPVTYSSDIGRQLRAFQQLTPAEVAVLPARMQFNVPDVLCQQLSVKPATMVGCTSDGTEKDLLGPAQLTNAEVTSALAARDDGLGWIVKVGLTPAGNTSWAALTTSLYQDSPDGVYQQAAFVLDGTVIQAPQIEAPIDSGPIPLSAVDQPAAKALATVLNDGPLPSAVHGNIAK